MNRIEYLRETFRIESEIKKLEEESKKVYDEYLEENVPIKVSKDSPVLCKIVKVPYKVLKRVAWNDGEPAKFYLSKQDAVEKHAYLRGFSVVKPSFYHESCMNMDTFDEEYYANGPTSDGKIVPSFLKAYKDGSASSHVYHGLYYIDGFGSVRVYDCNNTLVSSYDCFPPLYEIVESGTDIK